MSAPPLRSCDVTQTERHSRWSVVADVEDDAATVSGPTAQLTAVRPHTLPDSPQSTSDYGTPVNVGLWPTCRHSHPSGQSPVNIGLWHTCQRGIMAHLSPLRHCRAVPSQHRIMVHLSTWEHGTPVATHTLSDSPQSTWDYGTPVNVGLWHACRHSHPAG